MSPILSYCAELKSHTCPPNRAGLSAQSCLKQTAAAEDVLKSERHGLKNVRYPTADKGMPSDQISGGPFLDSVVKSGD